MGYYVIIKKNEATSYILMWNDVQDSLRSEKSEMHNSVYSTSPFVL